MNCLALGTLAFGLAAGPAMAADVVDTPPNPADMRLLRTPDIHGDTIVFGYGGDLWTVPSAGGQARLLAGSVGYQLNPKFSPDGQSIAFTGNYDGNNDVYTIPAGGGEPVRLTWHPEFDRVIDWQPDGRSVRFQSGRESRTGRDLQLFAVPVAGAMAQDIWIYDFKANRTEKATDGKEAARQLTKDSKTYKMGVDWSPDNKPLVVNDAALNLWLIDAASGDLKPIWADMDGLYVVTLQKDGKHPFPPENDEVTVGDDDDDAGGRDVRPGGSPRRVASDVP
jgi:dipeptidyl aminopeptidase/acylaminoacyl peptidase